MGNIAPPPVPLKMRTCHSIHYLFILPCLKTNRFSNKKKSNPHIEAINKIHEGAQTFGVQKIQFDFAIHCLNHVFYTCCSRFTFFCYQSDFYMVSLVWNRTKNERCWPDMWSYGSFQLQLTKKESGNACPFKNEAPSSFRNLQFKTRKIWYTAWGAGLFPCVKYHK